MWDVVWVKNASFGESFSTTASASSRVMCEGCGFSLRQSTAKMSAPAASSSARGVSDLQSV